jgi:hypothetical protein
MHTRRAGAKAPSSLRSAGALHNAAEAVRSLWTAVAKRQRDTALADAMRVGPCTRGEPGPKHRRHFVLPAHSIMPRKQSARSAAVLAALKFDLLRSHLCRKLRRPLCRLKFFSTKFSTRISTKGIKGETPQCPGASQAHCPQPWPKCRRHFVLPAHSIMPRKQSARSAAVPAGLKFGHFAITSLSKTSSPTLSIYIFFDKVFDKDFDKRNAGRDATVSRLSSTFPASRGQSAVATAFCGRT